MKILLDGRKLGDTGIGTYVLELLRELTLLSEDDRFLVVLRSDEQRLLLRKFPQIETVICPVPVFSLREQTLFRRLERSFGPDLIHMPHCNVPLQVSAPVICTLHDLIPLQFKSEIPGLAARGYYYWMNRMALKRSRAVIVPSPVTEGAIREYFGDATAPVHVIAEASAPVFNGRSEGTVWARIQDKWHIRFPYLLTVGLLKPHKQWHYAVDLLHALRTQHGRHDLHLLMAGPENARQDACLRETIERYRLENVVHTLGRVETEELLYLYQNAWALVFPSAQEGFGLPVLEAMACGAPVLGFDYPWLVYVGQPAVLTAPPGDTDALATVAMAQLGMPAMRARWQVKVRAHASMFSWQKAACQTRELYDQVVHVSAIAG